MGNSLVLLDVYFINPYDVYDPTCWRGKSCLNIEKLKAVLFPIMENDMKDIYRVIESLPILCKQYQLMDCVFCGLLEIEHQRICIIVDTLFCSNKRIITY